MEWTYKLNVHPANFRRIYNISVVIVQNVIYILCVTILLCKSGEGRENVERENVEQ